MTKLAKVATLAFRWWSPTSTCAIPSSLEQPEGLTVGGKILGEAIRPGAWRCEKGPPLGKVGGYP
jgi:hypothetical protein